MGLTWIKDRREGGQKFPRAGLYKILSVRGRLLYVGISKNHLISRARSHVRAKRLSKNVEIWVAAPKILTAKNALAHHFLELENDLIGSYYAKYRKPPPMQFFKRAIAER